MALVRIPPAALEVPVDLVSLAEARAHCRVDHQEEDEILEVYLGAAHEHAETVLRRAVNPGTYELVLDAFPAGHVELPSPGGAAVTVESVRYVDPAGAAQTLDPAASVLDADSDPARLFPALGTRWPATAALPGAVRIRFRADYSDARAIPRGIAVAVLLMVGHWFSNRESVITGTIVSQVPMGVEMLLWPHRLLRFS